MSIELAHGAASSNAYQEMVQLQNLAVKPFGPFGDYPLLQLTDCISFVVMEDEGTVKH